MSVENLFAFWRWFREPVRNRKQWTTIPTEYRRYPDRSRPYDRTDWLVEGSAFLFGGLTGIVAELILIRENPLLGFTFGGMIVLFYVQDWRLWKEMGAPPEDQLSQFAELDVSSFEGEKRR